MKTKMFHCWCNILKCLGCDSMRYSIGCTKICPSKCSGGCDVFNGSCIHGCSNPNALTIDCICKNITRKSFFHEFQNIFIMNNWCSFYLHVYLNQICISKYKLVALLLLKVGGGGIHPKNHDKQNLLKKKRKKVFGGWGVGVALLLTLFISLFSI